MSQLDPKLIPRIKRLDNRLANQIAAGEVVERPASVVKELMENAIDAGSTRIEVDLERGGTRLIRITDNGCGIVKQDLTLALSRHATSKILNIDDLSSINSLGFRGEALASIGSVSRLCLTSRTKGSDFAWQAIAEGRDMNVEVQPASATIGTRIEVRDLFYNTPARQKFLRTEKTEFGHVEEIFKRHALVNFETAFILKHNDKVVKRVPADRNANDSKRRIQSICGKAFADNAIAFKCQHDLININGWLGRPNFHRSESDLQYVFVNGRPVKDKMLNHAIRQAYQNLLPTGRMPTYVIFLQVNPEKIDVNVHPTKHEVRFEEQRMVHDLLVKSVAEALGNAPSLDLHDPFLQNNNTYSELKNTSSYPQPSPVRERNMGVGYSQVAYQSKTNKSNQNAVNNIYQSRNPSEYESNSIGILTNKVRLNNGCWVVIHLENAYIINEQQLLLEHLNQYITREQIPKSKPLLFPQVINLTPASLEEFETLKKIQSLGFVFEPNSENSILLQQIPNWLYSVDKQLIFTYFSKWVDKLSTQTIQSAIEVIYTSIVPLSNEVMNDLLANDGFSFGSSLGVKKINSETAQKLFIN